MSATRRDLARALKERFGGSIQENDAWIVELLAIITETVSQEERLELRRFGTFEARVIKAQTTVHPQTGEKVKHPKSYTVDFRPAEDFKEKLRKVRGKKKRPRGRK